MRVRSLHDLREVFLRQVIPLLQEYFFDDWSRVELVLTSGNGTSAFLRQEVLDGSALFGSAAELGPTEQVRYLVTDPGGWDADVFIGVYQQAAGTVLPVSRSEEHTSELQSLMRISYAVFCLKKKKITIPNTNITITVTTVNDFFVDTTNHDKLFALYQAK